MIRPIMRYTNQRIMQDLNNNKRNNKSDSESSVGSIQSSIANSIEELAMARSLFRSKNKNNNNDAADLSEDLGKLLLTETETQEALTKVLESKEITKETLQQALLQMKSDINKYQLLRYLLTNAEVSASMYQFIYEELENLKKKRKKLTSLDNIDSETREISEREAISAAQLQELFLSFLEYQGHITPYYDDIYKKSKKKYKKIIKFISKMLNYEIYALTAKDDIDAFIYMTEKRRDLNMLNDVYDKLSQMSEFENLDFVYSLLNNIDIEEFCDQLSVEQASKLVTIFTRVPQELFFSPEDKEEMLAKMKSNITYRFKRQWI